MESKLKKTVPKVQGTTRVSQTPDATKTEDFPPVPPIGVDESSAFVRRPRLSRSPVNVRRSVSLGETPPSSTTPVVPPAATVPPLEVTAGTLSPYEAVVATARQEEEERLQQCLQTLSTMKAATLKQPNMSMAVKDGILLLETNIHHILQLRNSWKSCEAVSSATQTTPSLLKRPLSSNTKRPASSPAEPEVDKRKKEEEKPAEQETEVWSRVVGKKAKRQSRLQQSEEPKRANGREKKKPPKRKKRPDAILIKPSDGRSYSDVLGQIRQSAKPEEKGAVIKGLRKTRAGDLLVELSDSSGNKSAFGADLQTILGNSASVRVLEPKSTLEVRDLDELTTEAEVETAAQSVLGGAVEVRTFVSKANSRGQKVAILTLGTRDAAKLLNKGHLKIGWVNCRIREKPVVSRCFKCLGFGHVANRCSGPDRSKACFRCGGQDHKASTCSAVYSCVLCLEAGLKGDQVKHAAGSGRCTSYRQALQKSRSNTSK